jgi:iron complex outermembrane receptor protein
MKANKTKWILSGLVSFVLINSLSTKILGQSATLQGTITDAETKEILTGANVVIASKEVETGTSTNLKGEYRFHNLLAGRYLLTVTYIGYEIKNITNLVLSAGETKLLNIALIPSEIEMNPIVITASRMEEKVYESPAAVIVLESSEIESSPALVPSEHLKGLTAIDVVSTGLNQDRVVIRGFNGAISSRLLVLTDNRIAQVPSLRFNVYNLISPIDEDIERMELVLGPGSALYGPNSTGGVLHMITKSPFESEGTSVTLGGGERNIFLGSFRHAGIFSDKIGYKISGQYYQGEDWEFFDPSEPDSITKGIQTREGRIDKGEKILNERDFEVEKLSGDARLDFRLTNDLTATLSGGIARISDIEITGTSAVQGVDWTSSYLQSRINYHNLFAQIYYNLSNAGKSFFLRSGDLLIDKSSLLVTQVQHGLTLMDERQRFIYGTDLLLTRPNTDYTLYGRNEDNDDINEIGVYLQSETNLSSKLKLLLAARIDDHNVLKDPVFSPRAAFIYRPNEKHNFRITYNRAFQTPEPGDFFFDLNVSSLGDLPYDVRLRGVPETGYNFRRDGNGGIGGLYMQSPFTPEFFGGPSTYLPAEATQMWDAIMNILGISNIPPPNSGQVGTILQVFNINTENFETVGSEDVIDIAPLEPGRTTTFEIGYKGLINDKLVLNANVYYENNKNFIAPYVVETPNVFFEPNSLAAYLRNFMSTAIADSLAEIITGIPVGTVTPEEGDPADLLVTTRTFADISHFGGELSLTYYSNNYWAFNGNYSYMSKNFWERKEGEPDDIALNAPKHKIGLGIQYTNLQLGLNSHLRMRYVNDFPVISGIGIGSVPSYFVMDLFTSYMLPFNRNFEIVLSVQNLLNNKHREFIAVPEIGRLAIIRLKYSF